MELVTAALKDTNPTSTWLTATKSASPVMGILQKVETDVLNAHFTQDLKVTIVIVVQIFAINNPSLYQQVNVKHAKREPNQISFGEDNVLLTKETRSVMTDKLS